MFDVPHIAKPLSGLPNVYKFVVYGNPELFYCSLPWVLQDNLALLFPDPESQFCHRKVNVKRSRDVRAVFHMLDEIGRCATMDSDSVSNKPFFYHFYFEQGQVWQGDEM